MLRMKAGVAPQLVVAVWPGQEDARLGRRDRSQA